MIHQEREKKNGVFLTGMSLLLIKTICQYVCLSGKNTLINYYLSQPFGPLHLVTPLLNLQFAKITPMCTSVNLL